MNRRYRRFAGRRARPDMHSEALSTLSIAPCCIIAFAPSAISSRGLKDEPLRCPSAVREHRYNAWAAVSSMAYGRRDRRRAFFQAFVIYSRADRSAPIPAAHPYRRAEPRFYRHAADDVGGDSRWDECGGKGYR